MSNTNRTKGHNFERYLVNLLKEIGFKNCVSSRWESKRMDDAKVDVCYTEPFYIQAKNTQRLGNIHDILASMPQKAGITNLVWHKRSRKGSIVAMTEEDFITILKSMIKAGLVKPKC